MDFDRLENAIFAGFTVGRLLGQDPFRATYEAAREGQRFALTVLHSSLSEPENEAAGTFLQAVASAVGLRHDNLAPFADAGEEEGLRYAAQGIEGPTLAELVEEDGAPPVAVGVEILRQVLRGLAAAHAEGLVHGALCPAYVFRASDGRWRILGLGFPTWLLRGDARPEDMSELGPAAYLTPEHLSAAPLTPAADLYLAGLVAFEVLTGSHPFEGEPVEVVRASHLLHAPPDPRESAPSLPPDLARFVQTLLAKDPADRFASAEEAARALETSSGMAPPPAQAPPAPEEDDAQDDAQDETQDDTQDDTEDETQDETQDDAHETAVAGSGGLLASAFSKIGEDLGADDENENPDLFSPDGLAKSPTQMVETAFASLGEDFKKKKDKDTRGPMVVQSGADEEPWDIAPLDEHASSETFDLSGPKDPPAKAPPVPDKEELDLEETEDDPQGEGPLGPPRVVTTLSEHFGPKAGPVAPEAPGDEGWVDMGPWAKKKAAEKAAAPPAPDDGGFSEFHELRTSVAREVESKAGQKLSPEEEVESLLQTSNEAWERRDLDLAGHALVKALTILPEHPEALRLKGEIDAHLSDVEVLRGRAEEALAAGRFAEAKGLQEEILERLPGNRDARRKMTEIEAAFQKHRDRVKWRVALGVGAVLVVAVGVLGVLAFLGSGNGNAPAPAPPGPESKGPTPPTPPVPGVPKEPAVDREALEAKVTAALERKAQGDWKGALEALRQLAGVDLLAERIAAERRAIEEERAAEGQGLLDGGRLEEAAALFDTLDPLFPGQGYETRAREARYAMYLKEGEDLLGLGKTDRAMEVLGKAVEQGVGDGRAKKLLDEAGVKSWRTKAEQFEATGYLEGAKFYYEKILKTMRDPEIETRVARIESRLAYDQSLERIESHILKGDTEAALQEAQAARASGADPGAVDRVTALIEAVQGMLLVPGGSMEIGDAEGKPVDKPVWKAMVPAFYVMVNEVTVAEYDAFLKTSAGEGRTPKNWEEQRAVPDRPVTGVTLEDAQAFARSRGLEIPTEEVWERAAKGDERRPWPFGGEFLNALANTQEAGEKGPASVTAYKFDKSAAGCINMTGNVAEWTRSPFKAYPGGSGDFPDGQVVIRGGDFSTDREFARSGSRRGVPADHRAKNLGFRCFRTLGKGFLRTGD